MKKSIKLKNAIALENELQLFLTEKGVVMTTKIKARKTANSFKNELEAYYDGRNDLIKELGEETKQLDQNGNKLFQLKDENRDEFKLQNDNALNEYIEIEVFLSIDDLESVTSDSQNYYGQTIDLFI